MITKRVYELVVGDVFIWNNVEWRVMKIQDGRIHFRSEHSYSQIHSFGIKNQMRVEYIVIARKSKAVKEEIE